jgi:1-acyl-sn-glycerol-3-phosphate acyltransferase
MSLAKVSRRAIVLPTVLSVQIAIILLSPLMFLVALPVCLVRRSSRPWRSVALVVAFAIVELRTVAVLIRGVDDVEGLVVEVLGTGYGAMRRILKVPIVIEDRSAGVADVAKSDGLIVLARHCGPGDSLYVAWLIAVYYGLSVRIVLKGLMRLEPAIDLAADRLPFCFVGDDPAEVAAGISELAATMSTGQALLLFPEGGNFTWKRWRAGIRYLAAHVDRSALRRAVAQTHTVTPRTGGTVAALQAAPRADVMVVTHSGFAEDGRDRPWWRIPIGRDFLIRTMLHPAADVPRDEAGAVAFLDTAWTQVDTWVEANADLSDPAEPLEPGIDPQD